MKIFNAIFLFLLIAEPLFIQAQKEAAVWPVGAGKQINFQSGSFEFTDFAGNPNAKASICDKDGNLVLYTDGRTIWNQNNEIVINGDKLISDDALQEIRPIFVPYPKKEGWYILIYEERYYINSNKLIGNTLYYAEINSKANNGAGEVLNKKIKIHDNYHSGPSIAGYCDNSYFWLVIDRNDNTIIDKHIDRIYFYKIDEKGVNRNPIINDYFDIGNSTGYRFSPNGDKFYFMFLGNSSERKIIADFNFKTGELYNHRAIELDYIWHKEFSPDSRLLYSFQKEKLIQLDVSYLNSALIMNSADTILTLGFNAEFEYPGLDLQLGPDGKMYFNYYDINDGKLKLGRINKPNNKGNACGIELGLLTLDFNFGSFPEFVTSFFRDKHPEMMDEVIANAGPDIIICSGSTAILGSEETATAFYDWKPALYLSIPFTQKTIISPPTFFDHTQYQSYTLRATDGNCWLNFDIAHATINPIPEMLPIDGSLSVCPFVEAVDYSTATGNTNLQWLVDGGEIVSDPSGNKVKINWGASNMNASISVFSTNSFGCSDTAVFPVRINVQLITETPKGPAQMCIAESNYVEYQIRNTNGSVYSWFPDAGEVVAGQGTNKVVVKWHGEGLHQITVEEKSVTVDTICFGESEPLFVEIVNDSLEISLQNVSYDLQNNLKVNYAFDNLQNHKHSLVFIKQNEFGDKSQTPISDLYDGDFTITPTANTFNTELVGLMATNSCNETFISNQLQTIVLQGFNDEGQNQIKLNWNSNQFWENDNLEHEIWHSVNGIDGWKMIGKIGRETEFIYPIKELSLTHFFRINEINRDKNLESWSNTIKIEVKDDLMIPDVFTPNGDGINDEWEIKNIYFHPFKEATVYNKYGEKVFECKNEFIPWNGKIKGEIFQGTYFYQIAFEGESVRYGQITILQ